MKKGRVVNGTAISQHIDPEIRRLAGQEIYIYEETRQKTCQNNNLFNETVEIMPLNLSNPKLTKISMFFIKPL